MGSSTGRGWQRPLLLGGAAAIVCGATLPPLVHVCSELAAGGAPLSLLGHARLWGLLLRSMTLAAMVTAACLVIGVPTGVLFARSEFPLRRVLFALHASVLFLPPLLPALGWSHVAGRAGSGVLFSDAGAILVMTSCFTPIVTTLTVLGVLGVDASLEEAGRIAGGPVRVAAFVLIPCARPAIALAALLVFSLSFSELGVPMFLRVRVYPAVVFARLGGMDFAPGEAALFVLPMLAVAIGLLAMERRLAGPRAAHLSISGRRRGPLFDRAWTPVGLGLGVALALLSVVPLAGLALDAARNSGLDEARRWAGSAPANSLRAAIVAALVATAAALVIGHGVARGSRAALAVDGLSALGFLVPSSILGIGLIGAWNRPLSSVVYTGSGVVALGFVARYAVVAHRVFASSVAQTPVSLEEAATVAGAGFSTTLVSIVARLSARGLFCAFALTLVFSLRDLETAALFYPPGGEPLTVRIFTLEANGPPGVVSALSLLQVLMTFSVVGAAALVARPGRAR